VEFRRGAAVSRCIAVVAAHPDDEVLGCGATIARHALAGDQVHILIVSEGITSRAAERSRTKAQMQLSDLAECAKKAHEILGSASLEMLALPDNRLDGVDLLDVVKPIETFLNSVRPETVYTHFPADLNVDHRMVSEAVQVACRPVPGSRVKQLLLFEVASSTEWRVASPVSFSPNFFVEISATLEIKKRALHAYASEMRPWPHARSLEAIDALAKWRGASAGVTAAEAFVLGRSIV
jgi:LmbE family N-acetylglucosaminyl deacetylase